MSFVWFEGGEFDGMGGDWDHTWAHSWIRVRESRSVPGEFFISPGEGGGGELYVLSEDEGGLFVYKAVMPVFEYPTIGEVAW